VAFRRCSTWINCGIWPRCWREFAKNFDAELRTLWSEVLTDESPPIGGRGHEGGYRPVTSLTDWTAPNRIVANRQRTCLDSFIVLRRAEMICNPRDAQWNEVVAAAM
jgi:hypothetical protein